MKLSRPSSQSRLKSNKHGYLMLDLIIVMTLTVMILSTTSIWLYKTIRYTAEVSQRDSHARNISRISRQLRSDARDASSISVESDKLTITTERKSLIEYEIAANSIHRKQSGGEKDHHDDFAFVGNAKLAWVEAAGSASLEIRRDFSQMSASKTKPSKGLDARIVIQTAMETSK